MVPVGDQLGALMSEVDRKFPNLFTPYYYPVQT